MNPLAVLITMMSSTGFKIVTLIMVVLILALVYMEFQKNILEVKVNKQQIKINDRLLAGTL